MDSVRRNRTRAFSLGLILCWLAAGGGLAGGQGATANEPEAPAKEAKGKWLALLQKHAYEYTIVAEGPEGKRLTAKMLPDPLMRWTQPIRGGDDGVLCLWVDGGRPVVAMTVFTFKGDDAKRWIVHEHQSLSARSLEGSWQGRKRWHTTKPGLAFEPVPGAPAPADTPAGRLRQMQGIVREFSANTVDQKGSTWPLRPLARPLYRYEDTGPAVADGAVFALVQGNDPEAFLLIEARPDAKGARWDFGVARLTDLELKVRLRGRQVFSVPRTNGSPDETYQGDLAVRKSSDDPADFERP